MAESKKIFYLPSLLLLVAYFFKLGKMPNQLLLIGGGFILILICLTKFTIREMKKSNKLGLKLVHFLFFFFNLFVIILPFIGVFNQGIIPTIIYFILALLVFIYFIKINETKYALLNFIQPANYRNFVLLNLFLFILNSPFQRVLPDNLYSPEFQAEYEQGKGTEIFIDEAHNNLHTASGGYSPFADILTKDGYIIKAFTKIFSSQTLKQVKILVICNALNKKNNNIEVPVYSAFDDQEIQSINEWVKNGGSLFLIADHTPFSSASKKLASTFGFEFTDGYAEKKISSRYPDDLFFRGNKSLTKNIITEGRHPSEYVDSVVTFVGQAFKIPDSAKAILLFNEGYVLNSPQIIENIESWKTESIAGFSQGASLVFGKGRIAAFGEASMFSSQLPAGLSWIKIGFNAPKAKSNYKLLLNTVHWLDNKMDE